MKKKVAGNKLVFFGMKKYFNIAKYIVLVLTTVIVISGLLFNYTLGPVSKDKTEVNFIVSKNSTYNSLASNLSELGLIRSELAYKIYIKLTNPKMLKAGSYLLNKSMDVKEIIAILEKGSTYNEDIVILTIPEGKNLEQIAEIVSGITNNTKSSIVSIWDSNDFVNSVIDKYWFINEDVLKKGIRHPLEGYLFPSTYQLLNENVTPEYVAYKLLDQMDVILTKYKDEIEASDFTIHQLLTLTSIVQYEAGVSADMKDIAQVFYNRLDINMKLQSSVTVCYAIGDVKHWTDCESEANANLNSPYNTYYHYGLPIGPILNSGEVALVNTLNPNPNDYLYFIANVCDPSDSKTYFAKNFSEHASNIRKYLTCY